jgi:hypothetical protein
MEQETPPVERTAPAALQTVEVGPLSYPPNVRPPYVPRGWSPERMAERATLIAARLAEGDSLRKIVKTTKPPMDMHTVFKWLAADPAFHRLYKLAREAQAEGYADEIVSISDEAEGLTDNAAIQAARLRVDSRKWVCSKLLAKVYGDKIDVAHSGAVSIAGISQSLKDVKPITFDAEGNEIEDAVVIDQTPVEVPVVIDSTPAALDDLL